MGRFGNPWLLVTAALGTSFAHSPADASEQAPPTLSERIAGSMWGLFIGDALAMPVHWYYGGPKQIKRDFGDAIRGYERSHHPFPESIMQLSNTGGAGRGSNEGDIVGRVILHGKRQYWARGGHYHYHYGMAPGDSTLEARLVQVVMRSIARGSGTFDPSRLRDDYVEFMTTPGTHNDSYASTCHRMFFKNRDDGFSPEQWPDNDGHNVDSMDGLVMPLPAILAAFARGGSEDCDGDVCPADGRRWRSGADAMVEAAEEGSRCAAVTRRSAALGQYISALARLLQEVLSGASVRDAVDLVAKEYYGEAADIGSEVRRRGGQDPMVACYIGGAFPALLHFLWKYEPEGIEAALLASANAGGENVHRGAVLGSVLGAAVGVNALPHGLLAGLVHAGEIASDVESFLKSLNLTAAGPSAADVRGWRQT